MLILRLMILQHKKKGAVLRLLQLVHTPARHILCPMDKIIRLIMQHQVTTDILHVRAQRERETCYLNPRILSIAIFSGSCGHVEITIHAGGHGCVLRLQLWR